MRLVARPVFRRGLEYVAVRPIKLTSTVVVNPGERVELPSYRLRSLFQRRRIGPEGHPWTEAALGSTGFPSPWVDQVPEEKKKSEPVKSGSNWTWPGLTEKKFPSRKKAMEWFDAQDDTWLDDGGR